MNKIDISGIAEQLQRVEHKMDLVLEVLAKSSPLAVLRAVGDPDHACPLCHQQVSYLMDIFKGHVTRQCGCGTGMAPSLNLNLNQTLEQNSGTSDD